MVEELMLLVFHVCVYIHKLLCLVLYAFDLSFQPYIVKHLQDVNDQIAKVSKIDVGMDIHVGVCVCVCVRACKLAIKANSFYSDNSLLFFQYGVCR